MNKTQRRLAAEYAKNYPKELQSIIENAYLAGVESVKKENVSIQESSFGAYTIPMQKWLAYKKSKGQSYKNETSVKTCFDKLVRQSGGNPNVAMEMIDNAIGNNYMGFFPLRNNKRREANITPSIFDLSEQILSR